MSRADWAWVRAKKRPRKPPRENPVRVVDLFCGCGGMSIGLEEAARRIGRGFDVRLAVDADPIACRVYKTALPGARVVTADVRALFPGKVGTEFGAAEARLADRVGQVEMLLGGPPCQGHSDLNNHTRLQDPRNELFLLMARAAEVLRPELVIVENVPPILRDRTDVVGRTRIALEKLGYRVDTEVVELTHLGIPQTRRRFLMLASRVASVDPIVAFDSLPPVRRARTVRWAIADLVGHESASEIDSPSVASSANRDRIAHLFETDSFDLPNDLRPECHQNESHSYKSMYGRLRWDQPAQTITTGFTSPGQGRFIHPSARRTLTPHEAARIQTFPDWFDWSLAGGRTALATMIGNAVPPLMMVRIGGLVLDRSTPSSTANDRPVSSSPEATKRMRAVRRKGTKPELQLERELNALGLRFKIDEPAIPGSRRRSDFLFMAAKVAIFVDGCFWHSCPTHATVPKANAEWWVQKLSANVARDRDTDRALQLAGFEVVRVWTHEDMGRAALGIKEVVDRRSGRPATSLAVR